MTKNKLESMEINKRYSLSFDDSEYNEEGTGCISLTRIDFNAWYVNFDILGGPILSKYIKSAENVIELFASTNYEGLFLEYIGESKMEIDDVDDNVLKEYEEYKKVYEIIQKAIFRTKEISPEYWDIMLKTRTASAESSGSFWDLGTNDLERCLNSVFEWKIVEGSPEEGRVVIRNFGDIQGWSGVCKKKSLSEANISVLENPKTGIKEQVVEYDNVISANEFNTGLPITYEIYIIISFKDPETGEINPEKPFILTLFPGEYLPSDACYEGGEYVKIINVGDLPRGYGYKDRLNSR